MRDNHVSPPCESLKYIRIAYTGFPFSLSTGRSSAMKKFGILAIIVALILYIINRVRQETTINFDGD